jgi:hypothetical protein
MTIFITEFKKKDLRWWQILDSNSTSENAPSSLYSKKKPLVRKGIASDHTRHPSSLLGGGRFGLVL